MYARVHHHVLLELKTWAKQCGSHHRESKKGFDAGRIKSLELINPRWPE